MKYLLIFIVFYNSFNVQSQNNDYYEIVYQVKSKMLKTQKQPKKSYASLYVYKDKSIYQWIAQRKLDSIQVKREITHEDLNRYFSREKYAIEFDENTLKYYDYFGGNEYQYEEKISFNWSLKPEIKTIKGYKCKKATLSYGGRDWVAWYTIDLPINAGPYKFKGLPGLIVKITDTTNSYDLVVHNIKTKKHLPLKKLFHLKKEDKRIIVDRNKYNRIRFKYKSLSFQERINLLNNKQGVTNVLEFTSSSGTNPFKNERSLNFTKLLNFIEIDHKK